MVKKYRLKNLDCANCAAKMEKKIAALPGVKSCSVNFMLERMTLEANEEDFERLLNEAAAIVAVIEPDCKIQ